MPLRIMCHGRPTLRIAQEFGWLPGARYTNLRDLRGFRHVGLIDIDWKNYDFERHLSAVRTIRPILTIARDIVRASLLESTLSQAAKLAKWVERVVIVPKDKRLGRDQIARIPEQYLLGYSVPTKYGKTEIPTCWFEDRPVHLLGGRPDTQFRLANKLNVFSLDGNRITLDAQYGDIFVGDRFKPHPSGGYHTCIRASLKAVNDLWAPKEGISCRIADYADVDVVKSLADRNKTELGFVLRPALDDSASRGELHVAEVNGRVVGYVRFHHRRDRVTKIYEICVDVTRRMQGVGYRLIEEVAAVAKHHKQIAVHLKCPEDLPANKFYRSLGFKKNALETGKQRRLIVWGLQL